MEKHPDIFYKLKDHSSPPPPDMIDRVWDALALDNADGLRRLQQHESDPPPALRKAILQKLSAPPRFFYKRLYQYAAAACVLVVAGLVSYHLSTPVKKESSGLRRIIPPTGYPGTVRDSIAANPGAMTAVRPESPPSSTIAGNGPLSLSLDLDGEKYPLTGNNLLTTLTSYEYPALKSLPGKPHDEKGWSIRLDHYTHISLSRAMTAMLQDCYRTRPDGSPDQKAKRTKQLLQKWSGQDRKQFAAGYMANPLDVVDLAQFLFPPVFSFWRRAPAPIPAAGAETNDPAISALIPKSDIRPVTIAYLLTLQTKKTNAGIGETYNGGMQTLFDAGHHARLRLASLMRIQSILFSRSDKRFTILTESSRPQQQTVLNLTQWGVCNSKYVREAIQLKSDTLSLLGYGCKKAIIKLRDGGEIIAWYTPDLRTGSQALLQPAFAGLPGLVLKYEYTCRKMTVQYTAASVSRAPIDPSIFNISQDR